MKTMKFTINDTGHDQIMLRPSQNANIEYEALKNQFLGILMNREFKFEHDKTDNRRTIECVKANKLTKEQLESLIKLNNETDDLLKNIK